VTALVALGVARFEPGRDPESAEGLLRQALQIDSANVDALFWLAKVRFHDYVDAAEAKDLLEAALRIQPECADCLSLLASVLADLDVPPEEYVSYVERAVKAEPGWPSLRHQYASVLVHLGRLDDAEREASSGLDVLRRVNELVPACYYEESVTGRRWPRMESDLKDILSEVAHRRARTNSVMGVPGQPRFGRHR
jgi:tetratricopeptide (TPR) repeat protein